MFMGTRTNLPGWGFQRRNAPCSLGFPECRGPATRPDPSLCRQCRGHGGDSPAGEPRTPRSGQGGDPRDVLVSPAFPSHDGQGLGRPRPSGGDESRVSTRGQSRCVHRGTCAGRRVRASPRALWSLLVPRAVLQAPNPCPRPPDHARPGWGWRLRWPCCMCTAVSGLLGPCSLGFPKPTVREGAQRPCSLSTSV